MKIISQVFAFFLLLSIAACFDPPKYRPENLDQIRIPQQQAVDIPARTYEFKGHSFDDGALPQQDAANVVNVALLLPSSGKAEKVGKMLADAAQLGLYTQGSENLRVRSYDTQSTSDGAMNAAYQAINDNPDVIIGPLFSNEVQVVAPIARSKHIPVIAFSNDKKVAGNGVYLLGLMPDDQIKRLFAYASGRGIGKYAALLPDNVLGNEVMFGLQQAVKNARGVANLSYSQIYSAADTNFPTYAADMATKLGEVNIDGAAIVLADAGGSLTQILQETQQAGLRAGQVRLLGVNAWDNSKTLANQALQGAWFTNVPSVEMGNFVDSFYSNFNYKPLPVAALSYDAILLTAELGKGGLAAGAIERQQGFYGANGAYRLRSNGTAERRYDVMEVSGGQAFVIDEAAKTF